MFKKAAVLLVILVTFPMLWFSIYDYRQAGPIAQENLRGLALSLTTAVENLAANDPSFKALHAFHPVDVAYFALIDRSGVYRFHSNKDLIGIASDPKSAGRTQLLSRSETRVLLGTGERAYQFTSPVTVQGEPLALVLTLHTYRADAVIRRARLNATIVFGLVLAGWLLCAVLIRYARREESHKQELARREALAKLGEMGALLAHEIRNPLAGIKGFAQIIAAKPQEARNGPFAQSIVTEAVRLEALVNDLLTYASNEPSASGDFQLCNLLDHVLSLLEPEARAQGVGITRECSGGVSARANRDRVEQALLNLGRNALQAMPDGGMLRFTAEGQGRETVITVEDNGHGIADEHRPHVFEPFFTTKSRGTGLGLALCKKIVEGNGGSITLHSREGEGTRVILSLPAATHK
ncbi:two-component system sensor histidine kinase NtrB [Geomonas edaphica]|uniref:two-component system sensor histidine kinase NtrB n=1 Tax=Geomonas edaphica TaxID=2570226 RepID=UPI0010A81732|nr:ATP-binding protein [Geomonas edaphica]